MAGLKQRRTKIVFLIVILIAGAIFYLFYFSNILERHKLADEVHSLKLSNSKPNVIGFTNIPTDPEQIGGSTHPGLNLTQSINQTSLGIEVNNIKQALQNNHYKVKYDPKNSPEDIIGISKNYFINIGIEFNYSALKPQKTNQISPFNGQPIFAEPGPGTPVNSLIIMVEDISKQSL